MQLKKSNLNLIIRSTKLPYKGPIAIMAELLAYREISSEISTEDYINKIDSDVILIGDNIYNKVISRKELLIGQTEKSRPPLNYTQGGCYFLKNSFIQFITNKKLLKLIDKIIEETPTVRTYHFNFKDEKLREDFTFESGQFGEYSVFGVGEATFCISSSPTRRDHLEFAVQKVGKVTNALHRLGTRAGVSRRPRARTTADRDARRARRGESDHQGDRVTGTARRPARQRRLGRVVDLE